jgi:hypothetical protein
LIVVLGLWVCDGEREGGSNVDLLLIEAFVLEREVEIIVVRLIDN